MPADLEEFWSTSLAPVRGEATLTPVDSGLVTVESFDVTFVGYGGAAGFPTWAQTAERLFGELRTIVGCVRCGRPASP